jgi:hypothetical protein
MNSLVAHQPFVADLNPQRVEEDDRVDRIERPVLLLAHLVEHGIGDPVDQSLPRRRPVSGETATPYSSSRCPWISRTDRPRAYRLMIRSSKPSSRVCPLAIIYGWKGLLRSRGTAISTAPSSPLTVLVE